MGWIKSITKSLDMLGIDPTLDCPKCKGKTTCIDSRDVGYRVRKRVCKKCGYSFATVEMNSTEALKLANLKRLATMIDKYQKGETI